MSGFVLAVRPEPGLAATMEAGKQLGLNMIGYPLFEVRPREWDCPDSSSFDAILIGSANAIRHGGDALSSITNKPVHAVGQTTAEAAQEAGFEIANVGTGGLQNVLDAVTKPTRFLRIAGEKHVPLTAPDGVEIVTRIAYESVPLELPEPLRALDQLGLTVLLHSAVAAERFDSETRRLALQRSRIKLAVLGPRIAEAAGTGWQSIHVSPAPNDTALLELVRETCI
ncbi:uroporphyrinogen III synthase [Erythrobacter sp. KY5]|uniref:uroporphyrinogen-III synthase n=1 Tax=Erythrobacter sp. KY5 TaxID=2011159 RepID=UPI000DBF139F|nr:uroporphyrinogen-III synthase [Erythrobacter sp. KY5]AWW75371.1 uroporphyrinogen III synthase [Erythrobacter sp. KY5]